MIKVMFRRVLSFLRRNVSLLQVFTVAVSAVFFNYCAQSETPLEEPEITVSPLMPSRTTAEKGGDVKLSAVITNNKEEAAENIMVKYYFLSAPELPTPEMPSEAVGSQTIPFLASGGAVSLRFDISTPETPGSYYYYVCIGDGFGNCAGPVSLNVVDTLERSVGTPDLIVDTPLLTRSVLLTEGLFTLSAIVRNQGSGTFTCYNAAVLQFARRTCSANLCGSRNGRRSGHCNCFSFRRRGRCNRRCRQFHVRPQCPLKRRNLLLLCLRRQCRE